jgi:hypothetical protein
MMSETRVRHALGHTIRAPSGAKEPAMRTLILLLVLSWSCATAQGLPTSFRSEDGTMTLYLEERREGLEARLMLAFGFLVPLDARLEGDELTAMGDRVEVAGRLADERLTLTLRADGEERSWTLLRRHGGGTPPGGPPPGDSPLLGALALVPDTIAAREGIPSVSYADLWAARRAVGLAPLRTREDLEALSPEAQAAWQRARLRVASGAPELQQHAPDQIARMPELLGFEWFDIEQALSYGSVPYMGTVLAAEVDAERLAQRLGERGFEVADDRGVTTWSVRGDGAQALGERETGDPFVGTLGFSVRLGVLPGYLVNARYAWLTAAMLAAARGDAPSLAESRDYRTLAEAIEDGPGDLVQAQFFGPLDVGAAVGDPFTVLRDGALPDAPAGESLPLYGLAVLADRQEGNDQVGVVALLYEDGAVAEAAARVLAERLARFEAERLEAWGARVDEPRVIASDTGLWAAVASVRVSIDVEARPGMPFAMWLQALVSRRFGVLAIGPG